MRRLFTSLLLILATFTPASAETEVDVELVLAVDVSRSMNFSELTIQREGYGEALRSDEVINAITGGLIGRIAVTYIEWAGQGANRVVVPWTLVSSREEAEAVADSIEILSTGNMRRTSISSAIAAGVEAFDDSGFRGLRRVIDISGDGPNNQGGPVTLARDKAVAAGITINGLPLLTPDDAYSRWNIPDLDHYYEDCVIGGPGAFVIPVFRWEDFGPAIRRKMVLEIAGVVPERLWQAQAELPYDCMIGEKIWQQYRGAPW